MPSSASAQLQAPSTDGARGKTQVYTAKASPQAAKVAAADVVIENVGSREALEARVVAAYRTLMERCRHEEA